MNVPLLRERVFADVIKVPEMKRSSRIILGALNPVISLFTGELQGQRKRRGDAHMKTPAEVRVIWLQAKEHHQQPAGGDFPQSLWKECRPANIDFTLGPLGTLRV